MIISLTLNHRAFRGCQVEGVIVLGNSGLVGHPEISPVVPGINLVCEVSTLDTLI